VPSRSQQKKIDGHIIWISKPISRSRTVVISSSGGVRTEGQEIHVTGRFFDDMRLVIPPTNHFAQAYRYNQEPKISLGHNLGWKQLLFHPIYVLFFTLAGAHLDLSALIIVAGPGKAGGIQLWRTSGGCAQNRCKVSGSCTGASGG